MQRIRAILLCLVLMGLPMIGFSAETTGAPTVPAAHAEEGLSQRATTVGHVGSFLITNSLIVPWIVALGLIILDRTSDV